MEIAMNKALYNKFLKKLIDMNISDFEDKRGFIKREESRELVNDIYEYPSKDQILKISTFCKGYWKYIVKDLEGNKNKLLIKNNNPKK